MRESTVLPKKQPRAEHFILQLPLALHWRKSALIPALSEQPSAQRCAIELYILCYVFRTLNVKPVWT